MEPDTEGEGGHPMRLDHRGHAKRLGAGSRSMRLDAPTMRLDVATCASPIGSLTLATSGRRLYALDFSERWPRQVPRLERLGALHFREGADPCGVIARLRAYFAGDVTALADIEVDTGGTAFQRWVWMALRTIAPGKTLAYAGLARQIGAPAAVRAVGAANGANPIAIVIPCHRVIGADGTLVGYAGGLDRKRWLLAHERACTAASRLSA